MLKNKGDVARVLEIARRFGVRVYLNSNFPSYYRADAQACDPRGYVRVPATRFAAPGPMGHACDVHTKAVWFDHFAADGVHTLLHEVMHCVLHPPWCGIDDVPEDLVLMQYERAIARQYFSPRGYQHVVDWQKVTSVEWTNPETGRSYDELGSIPHYTRSRFWREGFRALRAMGALDAAGRVTWALPDWRKATKWALDLLPLCTVPFRPA